MWLFLLYLSMFYLLVRTIYRLCFHPLHRYPGPRLAAITSGFEFYYDVIHNGRYLFKIEEMHQQYGPIVRITPGELHIKDPYFYEEVYAPASRKREKDPNFANISGFPNSLIATIGHDLHRFRRGILNKYFSKKSVLELSHMIHEKEKKLMQRFENAYQNNTIVRLDDAFSALTSDLIAQYTWGINTGFLDDKHFNNDIRHALTEISSYIHVNKFFPFLATVFRVLPRWFLNKLRPGATALLDMQEMVFQQAVSEKDTTGHSAKTIFDALKDPSLPPEERSLQRLQDEGVIMVIAGTETTARSLTVAAFYLFQDRSLLLKVREELRQAMPTPTTEPSWTQLEQLPYLSGVVNEAIRLAYGPIFRSTRVAPTESLKYRDFVIPSGTPVSMSSYFVLKDPEIFPDPHGFKPERWIEAAEQGQNLLRFLVSFSEGSRSCIGISLAYAELYLTLAYFVRRFDMELYETTSENIRIGREFGVGHPEKGEFLVRAKITKVWQE